MRAGERRNVARLFSAFELVPVNVTFGKPAPQGIGNYPLVRYASLMPLLPIGNSARCHDLAG